MSVLAGGTAPTAAVAVGNERLPDRLPLGPAHEGQLLSAQPQLIAALDAFTEGYDLVLIDAPPLLLSAEGEFVTHLADGAFLVVGANSVVPADLKRAARVLERLAPAVVGVLLNRVQVYDQGGSYVKLLKETSTAPAVSPLGVVYRWLWT